IPTIPTRMAETINLRMVKSFNRSMPSCLSYLNACPFWRKKPKKIPVMSPRIRVPNLFPPLPIKETCHDDAPDEETDEGNPTADSQLQRTADPVAARSAICHSGPKHQNDSAKKGDKPPLETVGSESLLPHGWDKPAFKLSGEPCRYESADEDSKNLHPLPVDDRFLFDEIGHGGNPLRDKEAFDHPDCPNKGSGDAEIFPGRENRKPAHHSDPG